MASRKEEETWLGYLPPEWLPPRRMDWRWLSMEILLCTVFYSSNFTILENVCNQTLVRMDWCLIPVIYMIEHTNHSQDQFFFPWKCPQRTPSKKLSCPGYILHNVFPILLPPFYMTADDLASLTFLTSNSCTTFWYLKF